MPGIVGIITKMPREWAEPQLVRMVKAMCHESFYESGTSIDESLGTYVGWAAMKDAFYFAGEAKAILAARPELRTPSPQGLGEFAACGCVLENRTIFKDIHVLPAASSWVFRNAAVERKSTYFDPHEWEQQSSLDP